MFENTSFTNEFKADHEKRESDLNITNPSENSILKHKNSLNNKRRNDLTKERNSQIILNFMKNDEDNLEEEEDDDDYSMFDDNQNSFIVYEKDKHEKRKNDKNK